MDDGHISSGQIPDGVMIQNDVGHVVLGQHVVRPWLMEINSNDRVGLRQDIGDFPTQHQACRFNAKQLDHRPVLVVFDEPTMVDATMEAAPFNQALDSKRGSEGIGIGIVVAEDRHVGALLQGSEMRVEHRGPCLAFLGPHAVLGGRKQEIFGAQRVGNHRIALRLWPDNRHVGPARSEGGQHAVFCEG